MTISSSLNAGVMGLNVNASRLSTISDNIANSATNGYKRSDVDFSSLVITQGETVYSAGGVRATNYKEVSTLGALTSTNNSTDLAINGSGMIPVTNLNGTTLDGEERDFLMVPTGGFSADENGFLRTSSGLYLLGWPTNSAGEAQGVSRGSASSLVPVNINSGQFSASPTENIDLGVNLPADFVPGADALDLPIEYFDSLGLAQSVSLSFSRNADPDATNSSWTVNIVDQAGDPNVNVATFEVQFSLSGANAGSISAINAGVGATYDAATGKLSFDVADGTIAADVGVVGGSSGLTQIGTNFSPYNVTKDGAPVGDLQNVEVNELGFMEAIYNTGFRQTLFQIPIADVTNPDGLNAVSNQAFQVSADSGDVYFWDAGDGPTGDYVGYALMESNTDIAAELTALIETQRAYSSNAKIIQTVDEMLQETTNLKR